METLYEIAVLGDPSPEQISKLEQCISSAVQPFGLSLGQEIAWVVRPKVFNPAPNSVVAAVFFGGKESLQEDLQTLIQKSIQILPVVSEHSKVSGEIPEVLRPLNCLAYNEHGPERVATALLECIGLLSHQRRIFLSYKRDEARSAALQLFDSLSSRHFNVFLDTHGIPPAVEFQSTLWHNLCDSDVLLMLDTPNYFVSRWTSAEFGRALAKGISVLRVGWPNTNISSRTATAKHIELSEVDIDMGSGRLTNNSITCICSELEKVRCQSHAVRKMNLTSRLRTDIEKIGGHIEGQGLNKSVHICLANNTRVVVYPTVGIPTSIILHEANTNAQNKSAAVIYDHIGMLPSWLTHLDWLGEHIRSVRCVKATEIAWCFSDWEE